MADLVRNLGSPHYDLGLVKLRQAHSLHLLGGGYVNGIWPHHTALISGMLAVRTDGCQAVRHRAGLDATCRNRAWGSRTLRRL
ncbi:hypothetical protein GCM10017708_01970 [Arthrobacter citreus]